MGVSEKVAYLKGLLEGLKLDESSETGKVFRAIADVLGEIALELEDLTDEVMEISDGLDVVSDDLEDVEELVYDEFDDEDELEDGAIACPNCGATLEFDAEDLGVDDGDE